MSATQDIQLANSIEKQALLVNKHPPFIHPLIEDIQKKFEKHKQNALPILSKVMTPYEAFKNGCEKAISSFIKLGQEGQHTHEIVKGPQFVNKETQEMETLIHELLERFERVKFVKTNNTYYAFLSGKRIDLSNILTKTNFNQIRLSPEQLETYHRLIETDKLQTKPWISSALNGRPTDADFQRLDPENLCANLTFPEKEAINIYTGNQYNVMNSLMRGDIEGSIDKNYSLVSRSKKEQMNLTLKENLLHIAVAVSALNKLPDFIPPVDSNGETSKYLYRGEGYLPPSVLAQRKWSVQNGGRVTIEMGFLSTAYNKPADAFFSESTQAGILFKNLKGKKVTPLSQFGQTEREILLPPTQIQWLYHKEIITDIFKNKMNLFIAKPVTVPYEQPTIENTIAKKAWVAKNKEPLTFTAIA